MASASGGYIRGNEIYDPLIDGKTVGTINGPAHFIPGVGLRLDDPGSYVEYQLPDQLTGGEYSALVSNLSVVSSTNVGPSTSADTTAPVSVSAVENLDDVQEVYTTAGLD